ncbi:MAG: diguanylate cyclase [Pseudomonadota bacterium]
MSTQAHRYVQNSLKVFLAGLIGWLSYVPSQAIAVSADLLPTQYLIDRFGRDEGLPSDVVWIVREGPQGYLWIGTRGGLVRFDGSRVTVFNRETSPGLTANEVRDLEWTPEGDLWIATYGGGVLRMRDGEFTSFTAEDGLAGDVVYDIFRDSTGAIWFGTGSGLSRFNGTEITSWRNSPGLASANIYRISEDEQGNIWTASLTDGLSFYDGSEFFSANESLELDSDQVLMIHKDQDLGMLASTIGGGVFQVFTAGQAQPLSDSLPTQATSVLRDRDSNLWLSSYDSGLWRASPGKDVARVRLSQQFDNVIIFDLLEDTRGNIWVTTSDGLFRIRDTAFYTLATQEGLAEKVTTLTSASEGNFWVGTEQEGLFRIDADGSIHRYDDFLGLDISSVAARKNGEVWVGTFTNGAYVLRNGDVEPVGENNGLLSEQVFSILELREGGLLIASAAGVARWNDASGSPSPTMPEVSGSVVRHINQTRDGSLWLSTSKGLFHYKDDTVTHWTQNNGLPTNVINQTYEDERGVLWVALRDGGIVRFSAEGQFVYGSEHGINLLATYAIVEDRSRNLWIAGSGALLSISRDELDAVARGKLDQVRVQSFDESDGLRTTLFAAGNQPTAISAPDNRLWFATYRGAVHFNPTDLELNRPALGTVIESVRVNGSPVALENPLTLPASLQTLEIDYTAPELADPLAVGFRYTVGDGLGGWQEVGNRRTAYFTALPAGSIDFRVQAKFDGTEFPPGIDGMSMLQLYRKPHWYETTWSVLVGLVLFALFLVGFQQRLSRQANAREAELRQLVDQRTEELRDALNRVEANARIDSLTGIANRRHMDEQLKSVWNMARRTGVPVSVVMLDIDRFKQYNDSLGHNAGDMCLRKIAAEVDGRILREHDMVARYGGEEFLLVLYDSDLEGAERAAERILAGIRDLKIPHPDSNVLQYVTVSMGYATAVVEDVADPYELVKLADKALYAAKQAGRNRAFSEQRLG